MFYYYLFVDYSTTSTYKDVNRISYRSGKFDLHNSVQESQLSVLSDS
jgi:hypothetical protein